MFGAALSFIYGLLIGSFLNAWLWRTAVNKSIKRGRSQCPDCGHTLTAKDLIPVVSWLGLRGRCRYCGKAINWQYPAIELLTAVLFLASYLTLAPSGAWGWIAAAVWLYLLASLIFLAIYDARHLLLPDKVLLPAIAAQAGYLLLLAISGQAGGTGLIPYLLTALIAGGVFYALVAVSQGRWLGGGDIKLVFLMGLVLGPSKTLLALFLAFNSAAVVGVALILLKRKGRKDTIAFGPFLIAATICAYLVGQRLIDWYWNLSSFSL